MAEGIRGYIRQKMAVPTCTSLRTVLVHEEASERTMWAVLNVLMDTQGSIGSLDSSSDSSPEKLLARALLPTLVQEQLYGASTSTVRIPVPVPGQEGGQGQGFDGGCLEDMLLLGRREEAVDYCIQCKQWAMALLVSSICSTEKYQYVVKRYAEYSFAPGTPLHMLTHLYANIDVPSPGDGDDNKAKALMWRRNLAAIITNKGAHWERLGQGLGDELLVLANNSTSNTDVMAAHVAYLCSGVLPCHPSALRPPVPATASTGNGTRTVHVHAPVQPVPSKHKGMHKAMHTTTSKYGRYCLLGCDVAHVSHRHISDTVSINALRMTEILEYCLASGVMRTVTPTSTPSSSSSLGRSISGFFGFGSSSNPVSSIVGSTSTVGSTVSSTPLYISEDELLSLRVSLCPVKLRFAFTLADFGLVSHALAYTCEVRELVTLLGVSGSPSTPKLQQQHDQQLQRTGTGTVSSTGTGTVSSTGNGTVSSTCNSTGTGTGAAITFRPFSKRFAADLEDFLSRLNVSLDKSPVHVHASVHTSSSSLLTVDSTGTNTSTSTAPPRQQDVNSNSTSTNNKSSRLFDSFVNVISSASLKDFVDGAGTGAGADNNIVINNAVVQQQQGADHSHRGFPPSSLSLSTPVPVPIPVPIPGIERNTSNSNNYNHNYPPGVPNLSQPQHLVAAPARPFPAPASAAAGPPSMYMHSNTRPVPSSIPPISQNNNSSLLPAGILPLPHAPVHAPIPVPVHAHVPSPYAPAPTPVPVPSSLFPQALPQNNTNNSTAHSYPNPSPVPVHAPVLALPPSSPTPAPTSTVPSSPLDKARSQPQQQSQAPQQGDANIVGKFRKGLISWLYPEAHNANDNLGQGLEARYDEATKRWIFPGEENKVSEESLGPPPMKMMMSGNASIGPGMGPAASSSSEGAGVGGGGGYDPLAALMAPPPRSSSYGIPTSSSNSFSSGPSTSTDLDPLAAMMAPPPMRQQQGQGQFAMPPSTSGAPPSVSIWKPTAPAAAPAPIPIPASVSSSGMNGNNNTDSNNNNNYISSTGPGTFSSPLGFPPSTATASVTSSQDLPASDVMTDVPLTSHPYSYPQQQQQQYQQADMQQQAHASSATNTNTNDNDPSLFF